MGPYAHLWCLQLGSTRLLRYLLCTLPGVVAKAEEVRYFVSCHIFLLYHVNMEWDRKYPSHPLEFPERTHPVALAAHRSPAPVPFVLKRIRLDLLQLPVMHKLSISHDLPKESVPRPVTGKGDLQGTSALVFTRLPNHPDLSCPSST